MVRNDKDSVIKMCSNCNNLQDVMINHYPNEYSDPDSHETVRLGDNQYYIRLTFWPTWISQPPTMEELLSLIQG
mgnify:FL=1